MDFAFSEEQDMLRQSVRDFLTKECGSKVVRKLMESPDSYDPALWKKIADLGWTALGIPETYGGVGGFLDLIVVFEEAGRALCPDRSLPPWAWRCRRSSKPEPRPRRKRC